MDNLEKEACSLPVNDILSVNGSPLPGLTCPICTEVFVNPVFVTCCGNTFCRECIEKSLITNDACPLCRASLLEGLDYILPNRAIQELISSTNQLKLSQPSSSSTTIEIDSEPNPPETPLNPQSNQKSKRNETRIYVPNVHVPESQFGNVPQFLAPNAFSVRNFLFRCPGMHNVVLFFRRTTRWFILNEARLRFMIYMATTAFVVIYLRVQEEIYVQNGSDKNLRHFLKP